MDTSKELRNVLWDLLSRDNDHYGHIHNDPNVWEAGRMLAAALEGEQLRQAWIVPKDDDDERSGGVLYVLTDRLVASTAYGEGVRMSADLAPLVLDRLTLTPAWEQLMFDDSRLRSWSVRAERVDAEPLEFRLEYPRGGWNKDAAAAEEARIGGILALLRSRVGA